jgi:SAM-dependent MidA family methyltransferase
MLEVSLHERIVSQIRTRGPLTVAAFMTAALYDPEYGYYAISPQRSGRSGDFFTSVDASPLFGEMVALQLAEMRGRLGGGRFDLVEAGAGNGRLARDILDAAARHEPDLYEALNVTLVERSEAARREHPRVLAAHAGKIAASRSDFPSALSGAVIANELLDAFPVHVLVRTRGGFGEVYVTEQHGQLRETVGPLSDERLVPGLGGCEAEIAPGTRVEVSLEMPGWIAAAARALDRGFLLLFDYTVEAAEIRSGRYPDGTLLAYSRHTAGAAHWLDRPGACDLTAHVNLDALRAAALRAGLEYGGCSDQTHFLLSLGIVDRLPSTDDTAAVTRRLAAKTLLMPGGLGSTMKAIAFGRNAAAGGLRGFAHGRAR